MSRRETSGSFGVAPHDDVSCLHIVVDKEFNTLEENITSNLDMLGLQVRAAPHRVSQGTGRGKLRTGMIAPRKTSLVSLSSSSLSFFNSLSFFYGTL